MVIIRMEAIADSIIVRLAKLSTSMVKVIIGEATIARETFTVGHQYWDSDLDSVLSSVPGAGSTG
jgi:hypothetical protein